MWGRISRHAAALVAEIVYGYQISGMNDEYVRLAEQATTETVEAGSPGSNVLGVLVDFFPIRMFPSLSSQHRISSTARYVAVSVAFTRRLQYVHFRPIHPIRIFEWEAPMYALT